MSKEREQWSPLLSLDLVARQAMKTVLREGRHPPVVLIEGRLQVAACQINELGGTHAVRLEQMRTAGYTLGKSVNVGDPEQVFFVFEGWLSATPKGKLPATSPSQDPNRVEVLLINQLLLKSNQTKMIAYEMIRASDNKLVGLRKLPMSDEEDGKSENFLLTGFVKEYRAGRRARNN